MATIQPLPADVINIIAAGEVIDSVAAVVRELVENAIDAGAGRIAIALDLEQWRVQVADDGQGMDRDNLRSCAQPHSTSKIHTTADLWRITSLGFRGEALQSIAQLSRLEIRSRPGLAATGWRVSYDQRGEVIEMEPDAIAPGTIITVHDLFGRIPVRRHGLPAESQQLKEIQTLIHHFALCYPRLHWQISRGDRPWLKLFPGESPQDILPQLLPRTQPGDFAQFTQTQLPDYPDAQIQVVVGLPDRCHRRRADWLKVAINGRWVRSPALEQTLLASVSRTLPKHRYPVAFLHLTLPPAQIDWNRHPAKTEVYLHHLDFWRDRVRESIDQALRLSPADLTPTAHNQRLGTVFKAAASAGTYTLDRQVTPLTAIPQAGIRMPLRVVAQVNQMYIVAEHEHGLWLIEQHIAHERVLFEQLQAAWQLVELDPPLIVAGWRDRQVEQLQRIGITVDVFGENLWAVRHCPALLAEREDCMDALVELSLGGDLETAQVATACRSAIRNGTPLSLPAMQTLVEQWQRTHNPRTCPHGRPIYLALDETSLSRFFRRHWVVGKSHGL
jgi:DNA mismatch repair protein MutL